MKIGKSILLVAAISWILMSAAAPAMECGSIRGLPCAVTVSCAASLNCSTIAETKVSFPSLQTGRQTALVHERPRKEHIPLPDFPPPERAA